MQKTTAKKPAELFLSSCIVNGQTNTSWDTSASAGVQ